jgi:hypothetical protein
MSPSSGAGQFWSGVNLSGLVKPVGKGRRDFRGQRTLRCLEELTTEVGVAALFLIRDSRLATLYSYR